MLPGLVKFRGKELPHWVLPAVGYVFSIACLIWVFKGVDFRTMRENFREMHWGWVTVAVASDIAVYVFQAWRWNLLLSPVVRAPLWRSVQAIYVGLFTNEVFPLRPGELIRCFLQARWSELPFSVALSSVIIERIFDGIWLVLVFAMTAAFVQLPASLVEGGRLLAAVTLFVAVMLGLVMFRKHHAHAAVSGTRWSARLQVLVDDLHLMGNSPTFYAAAAASLLYLALQVLPVYALIRGFEFDLSMGAATVVLIIWRLGTVLPQAPGNIGSSQALMVLALGLFGVGKTDATSFSVMTWLVITLPLLVAGFIALAITDLRLDQLRHHAKALAAAPPAGAPANPSAAGGSGGI